MCDERGVFRNGLCSYRCIVRERVVEGCMAEGKGMLKIMGEIEAIYIL